MFPRGLNVILATVSVVGLLGVPSTGLGGLVEVAALPDTDSDPIFATISGANYFAEANLATGTLKASSTDPSDGTTGPQVQSGIAISFENVSSELISFHAGSLSLVVEANYSQTYDFNIGAPTVSSNLLFPRLLLTGPGVFETSAVHDVLHEFTIDGDKSLSRNDLLLNTAAGGQVIQSTVTGSQLSIELLSAPVSIAPGENLEVVALLGVTIGGGPNITTVTNAADTAFLTFTLPEGVSPDDLWADTSADLVWVTTVPVPPALWLFGSALGLLGWLRRRRAV